MEHIRDRLKDILFEGSTLVPTTPTSSKDTTSHSSPSGPKDMGSGAGGGKQNFKRNEADKGSTFLKDDARRKRKERSRVRNNPYLNKTPKKIQEADEEEVYDDRRDNLEGVMKLNLKETFIKGLIDFYQTKKFSFLKDVVDLIEEYPKLKKYVKVKTLNAIPKKGFSVYFSRLSTGNENVGDIGYRSGDHARLWFINSEDARNNISEATESYIIQSKILPSQVLLYIPAFTQDIEDLVLSGKIEEPEDNIVRKMKRCGMVILPKDIDTGLIVEVTK